MKNIFSKDICELYLLKNGFSFSILSLRPAWTLNLSTPDVVPYLRRSCLDVLKHCRACSCSKSCPPAL